MVRCQECGFTNEPGAPVCKKCGSRIESSEAGGQSSDAPKGNVGGNPTMIGGAASGPAWDSGNSQPTPPSGGSGGRLSNPTVIGSKSNMPAWDEGSAGPAAPASGGGNAPSNPTVISGSGGGAATGNVAKCPSCGFYPLRNDVSASHPCPNCGNMGTSQAAEVKQPEAYTPAGQAPQPAAGHQMQKASGAQKTMRLGDLTPEEEQKPEFRLVDERSQNAKEFTGEEVSVNRDNLDAGNMSISGQEHAKFVMEDGKWFLSDHSSNGATFLQVSGKVELTDGAKILIGNRIYTFESK